MLPALLWLARLHDLSVAIADLGDYSPSELRSEYDPCDRAIRINSRVIAKLDSPAVPGLLAHAVAHELYHHLEHCAGIRPSANRANRERLADRFAREMLAFPA